MGNGEWGIDNWRFFLGQKGWLAADFEADVADGLLRGNKPNDSFKSLFCHCEAVEKRVKFLVLSLCQP